MSWEIFKQNILNVANSPEGIPSTDFVADLFAKEYDAAIKRGGDSVNNVSIKRGNVELMKQLFKAALEKGLTSKVGYDLVGEMGQGVLAYWAGATLNEFPIPKIPATGATQNIAVTSNIVTNAGSWQPVVNADAPPSPPEAFNLDEEAIKVRKEELADAKPLADEGENTAGDYVVKLETEIEEKQALSIIAEPTNVVKPRFVAKRFVKMTDTEYSNSGLGPDRSYATGEIGARIVAAATADIGIMEGRNNNGKGKFCNSGGKTNPNGSLPLGQFGRIDQMHQYWGLDNLQQLQKKGDGYFWCASAVGTWWLEAGIDRKTLDFRIPWVPSWVSWAQKNGLWSSTPAIGAAVIYKGGEHKYCHIGIVSAVVGKKITTIEGNTSGAGFTNNGVGCFAREPNISRVAGYVIPPGASVSIPSAPTTNTTTPTTTTQLLSGYKK